MPTTTRRRPLSLVLLLSLCATVLVALPGSPAAAQADGRACADPPLSRSFPDVDADAVFAPAIRCIAGYGIVAGFGDGRYRPGAGVQRGQAASYLASLIELADGAQLPDGPDRFTDVAPGDTFGRQILRVATAGIVQGVTSSRFGPGGTLRRGQMSSIVATSLGVLGVELDGRHRTDYGDVPDDGVFADAIAALTNAGVVGGFPDGSFRPGAPVTRGQFAAFVAEAAQVAADNDAFLPLVGPIGAGDWTQVRGSLEHARTSRRTSAGPQVINVLRWQLGDTRVKLSGDYAGSATSPGTVLQTGRRNRVVAAVNGGFWRPGNDPNGILVRDGRMVSDPSVYEWWISDDEQVRESQFRSAFGLHADGSYEVGEVGWEAMVSLPTGTILPVDALNRQPWDRDEGALVFTRGVDLARMTASGYYFVLDGVPDVNRSGSHTHTVVARRANSAGPVDIGSGQSAVFVPSDVAEGLRLGAVKEGDALTLDVQMDAAWAGTRTALVGGPLLLENANATSREHWRVDEAFERSHTDSRHPRTAIGFTGDGTGVVVTVDGRRPGASIGMTTSEMINYLRNAHGVRDAVMMDGGGSTQMVLDNQLANRPCCDRSLRRVATAMVFEAG